MSLSKRESPITKVIFLQKIFRFAGRTVTDLAIINFVCKDFEETMQAHHTFNLVLCDNIIKKRIDEDDFLYRSVRFLCTAPAWIVYQWTTVNEHDETQRELLKACLLYQAKCYGNKILIRINVSGEDPSTTHELLRHILDSCIKLGIVKEVLEDCSEAQSCIMQAVSRKIPTDSLALLIDSCVHHGLEMKEMLEQHDYGDRNCIMLGAGYQCPVDTFTLLIESCIQHGVDLKKLLERLDTFRRNCMMLAIQCQLSFDSFRLLIDACVQHGLDVQVMLEQTTDDGMNCISLAAGYHCTVDSLKLLIANFPSNESFCATLAAENKQKKRAVDFATTDEIKALLEDPDCWNKCREWCTSNGIAFQGAEQESGTRREREST